MAPLSLFSVFLCFLLLLSPAISTNSEGNAFHALRSRLSDPTNVLQSWDPTLVNPCTCDFMSPGLGELKYLWDFGARTRSTATPAVLELYKNDLQGKISKELGNLKDLVGMDLYGNRYEGEIPKSFAKLMSLRFLHLNNNKLTGSIPRELTTLSNLKVFFESNNRLNGLELKAFCLMTLAAEEASVPRTYIR